MRHMATGAGAAAEEPVRSRGALLRSRDDSASADRDPEAEAEHTKHTRIHTLVIPLGRTRAHSESGLEQDSDVHEDPERINDFHALHAEGGTAGQSGRPRST